MNVLVAFGTTEGQTRKIAERIADKVRDLSHSAETYDCSKRSAGRNISSFDAIVIAASVHQELHQKHVIAFAIAHRQHLAAKPSAFVSVSLSSAFDDRKADARTYVDSFLDDTGWQPTQIHMAAGALRYTEYDFFKEQVIRHIVMEGQDLPGSGQDCELTDWKALDGFTTAFVEATAS